MISMLPQQIDLWRLPIRPLSEGLYQEYVQGLSFEERAQHDAFYFSADRLRYLLTRIFTRQANAAYLGLDPGTLEFSRNPYGRPALSDQQNHLALDFNVAHNEDYLLCAITRDGRVGVDIENYRKPCNMELAEDFFSVQELTQLRGKRGVRRDKHFCALWTLKESFIKAVGKGMSIPLDAFCFQFGEGRHAFFDPEKHGEGRAWQFMSWETEDKNRISIAAAWDVPFLPGTAFRLNVFEPEEIPLDFGSFHKDNLQSGQISNLIYIHNA